MTNDFWSCGNCGNKFPQNEGRISKDSEHHASFMCGVCANKKIYKIEITFTTDQELTNGELLDLENAITLQIEEPTDYDQNDVSYETKEITYKMEKVK